MTDRLAAVAYRILAPRATAGVNPASGDDLANLVTTDLPNHALCFGANTLLQLQRDDNSSAALVLPSGEPVIVVPNSGPGRWYAVSGAAMAAASQQMLSTVHTNPVVVGAPLEWAAMPTSAAFVGSAGRWFSQGSAAGVLTYNGPPARFRASFGATFLNSIADTTQVRVALSIDGADIGTTNSLDASLTDELAQGVFRPITLSTLVDLTQGQTIQPIATTDNGDDPTVHRAIFALDLVGSL